jgi:hypothetical protein
VFIEEFVKERERDEKWFFRQAADGNAFWINHERKKAVKEYPYLKEIKSFIDSKKEALKAQRDHYLKQNHTLIKLLFRKKTEEEALKILMEEAKNFVDFYLANRNEVYQAAGIESKTYSLVNLVKLMGAQVSKQDIMDILFYCQFDFSQFIAGTNLTPSGNLFLYRFS